MSISKQSREALLDAILSITDTFGRAENATVTDLYFQLDRTTGTIAIFDDDDRELAAATIAEWKESEQEQSTPIEKILRTVSLNVVPPNAAIPSVQKPIVEPIFIIRSKLTYLSPQRLSSTISGRKR